jgi:O-acetyl-ADP-ribose deacetylase (regulator of RNase III)/ADP-ribose pyrophosphatase YjhB (NUDIX family)
MKIKNTEIKILKADITELKIDAIVNAANNQLLMGGGVAGVIRKKGGQEIEEEALKKGPIKIGEAVWTKAGRLPSRHVIHAATMGMDFKTDEGKIRASCANALKCADELKVRSIAFPALGCGVGGFPLVGAAKIMTQEILKHLRGETSLREIIFCLYSEEAYQVFQKQVTGYIEHIVNHLGQGPYITVDVIIELSANGRDLAKLKDFGGAKGIVVIERSNPPYGLALPGGFVDYGETLEQAVVREAKEETNLELENLKQFHTYSDPNRDPRFHTISTVFIATGKGNPRSGDDARGLKVIPRQDLLKFDYAFDHKKVIEDYLKVL